MPEIAEIARIVHFLRHHLVGKKIAKVQAPDDAVIFGKVGTTGPAFEAALKGKKVIAAGNQGKYFWLILDSPPHPVMHFGMTGWIHIKGERTQYTNYYNKLKSEEKNQWPPKFWKFQLETEGSPKVEVAFTDPRRFGRIRLVDCPGDDIRKHSPLVENGPDPVVDTEIFTEDYLRDKMESRKVPIKALILDQTVISGVGNWVADESLYQAKLHPEQYCNDFSDEQIKELYRAIRYVCQLAVDKLGDSDEFPEDWIFHHRWDKGKKGATGKLPNGERLAFLTVGGRTSCYAPNIQKKTGAVVPGVREEPLDGDEKVKPSTSKAVRKPKAEEVEEEEAQPKKRRKTGKVEAVANAKKAAPAPTKKPTKGAKRAAAEPAPDADAGRRRSGRLKREA
ncbi:Formamidopyrimidine-DNA glycosylase [Pleurostoma richardsiae]|uniref:Formamidopyrimidine-DNA glycosylase n=1 Tax=Pleurostoma richardsiae TaxID=41990 RepID=A0AA38RZS2_9PEZI|nr:Formamidopyrimidine-DNA glycosylase [Pleurostoma richardsiae]